MKQALALSTSLIVITGTVALTSLPQAASATPVDCTPEATYTTCKQFNYTGSDQTFTVPSGVTQLKVEAWAGGGGGSDYVGAATEWNVSGAAGGYATAVVNVSSTASLVIVVGGGGQIARSASPSSVTPVYGGGGIAGAPDSRSASGGGMSAVYTTSSAPQLIAGGGGGGTGGIDTNTAATASASGGGGGGGLNGHDAPDSSWGGGGGTLTSGGAAASDPGSCASVQTNGIHEAGGSVQNGGTGGAPTASPPTWAGAGGGGGYFGGGGGRCYDNGNLSVWPQGSGGGGSGFLGGSAVSNGSGEDGANGSYAASDTTPAAVLPGGTTSPRYLTGIGVGGRTGTASASELAGGNGMVTIQYGTRPPASTFTIYQAAPVTGKAPKKKVKLGGTTKQKSTTVYIYRAKTRHGIAKRVRVVKSANYTWGANSVSLGTGNTGYFCAIAAGKVSNTIRVPKAGSLRVAGILPRGDIFRCP